MVDLFPHLSQSSCQLAKDVLTGHTYGRKGERGREREAAGAGRNTMETAQLGFSARDREKKEPWTPQSSEAQRVLLAEGALHRPTPGPDKMSTEETYQ